MKGQHTGTNERVGEAQISLEGEASIDLQIPEGEKFDRQYLEHLSFMNEPVTIVISEAQREDDEPVVPVCVNGGKMYWLRRGVAETVPRHIVATLLEARVTRFRNRSLESMNEAERNNLIATTAMKYPLTPIEDSRRGLAWFKAMLASAR